MTQGNEVDVFNRRLDSVLGIAEADDMAKECLDADTQEVLQVAEMLAAADFEDELRPSQVLLKQTAHAARAASPVQRVVRRLRFALALIAVLTLIVAGLLAVGPERALAALGRLLGYIPGVGFVDDTQMLRTIPAPVSQEREGITLVVEQAVADSLRTVIVYRVDGLSLAAANSQGEDAPTGSRPTLRLPDGTALDLVEGEARGWGSGFRERLVYPALPPDAEFVSFEVPRLMDMPAGAAPEDWVVPLHFVPAPPDLTVVPVFEQETAEPTAQSPTTNGENDTALHGITLHVDRFVPLDAGYLVEGSLTWDERYPAEQGVADIWDMKLTDASGREVPIEPRQPDTSDGEPHSSAWAYKTPDTSLNGPLTFTMGSVSVNLLEPVSFRLDPGESPQEGKTWELGLDVDILGFPVHILSARYLEKRGMQGFEVVIRPDPSLLSFQMEIASPDGGMLGSAGGGGSHPTDSGEVIATVLTDGKIDGPVTLAIRVVGLRGPWSATWNPPAGAPTGTEATPVPEACAGLPGGWKEVLSGGSVALPQGLSGRIVGYGPVDGSDQYVVYVSNLDGSDLRVLAEGTWPMISPDGSQTAYSATDGINIADNATGATIHLPGTLEGDYHPLWTSDASRIAFVRVADLNIYVVNSDGSDLRQMTRGVEYELLAGWSPDGAGLYYTVLSQADQTLRVLDVATGAVRDLFTVGPKDVPSISPDGQWVAYMDRVFGRLDYSLFVSSLDGSERRLLADSVAGHLWSPDGNWLIVSVSDPDQMFAVPMPVLIQVNTCQVIPLPWLTGDVQGWSP